MKTVLIVEDDTRVILNILTALGCTVRVVVAMNVGSLGTFVDGYTSGIIDAAIFDARLNSKSPNTRNSLRRLRELGFEGPILANSGTENSQLLEAGASEESSDKNTAGEKILDMLTEQDAAWIPAPIRELIGLYDTREWDQLASLMADLNPVQIRKLREKMDEISGSQTTPDKYKEGAVEIRTAISRSEDPKFAKSMPLEDRFQQVLAHLQAYFQ